MSRVGKLPIKVPNNITILVNGDDISFDSGKIKKTYKVSVTVRVIYADSSIKLVAKDGVNKASTDLGMDRSNIKNIVAGMIASFKITLEINGVGYKAAVDNGVITLNLGYSHEIAYCLPNGITAVFEKPNLIILTGEDKILVGQVASEIISFRKPEPYKGKGVKIFGKYIVRKEGKKK